MEPKNKPLKKEEDVQQNPDEHIDQDFPGFPHPPADKKTIQPQTETEKKSADVNPKETEKPYGG